MDLLIPEPGLVLWQIFSFLIVLIILAKFAWKPIVAGIDARNESIEEALASAEKARQDMADLKSENEKLLDEARQEREKILKDANAMATNIKEQAKEEAQKMSQKIVDDARATIQTEKEAALRDVKNQVVKFSLDIAEKLVKKNLSESGQQKELVRKFVDDLNLN